MGRQKKMDGGPAVHNAVDFAPGQPMAPAVDVEDGEAAARAAVEALPEQDTSRAGEPENIASAVIDHHVIAPRGDGPLPPMPGSPAAEPAQKSVGPRFARGYYAVTGTIGDETESEETVLHVCASLRSALKWARGNRMFTRRLFVRVRVLRVKEYMGNV